MKPLCDTCGTRHESYQGHVFASNTASNRVATSNRSASNTNVDVTIGRAKVEAIGEVVAGSRERRAQRRDRGISQESGIEGVEAGKGIEDLPVGRLAKQRWSRDAYNAYQREYMKKRRAK